MLKQLNKTLLREKMFYKSNIQNVVLLYTVSWKHSHLLGNSSELMCGKKMSKVDFQSLCVIFGLIFVRRFAYPTSEKEKYKLHEGQGLNKVNNTVQQ